MNIKRLSKDDIAYQIQVPQFITLEGKIFDMHTSVQASIEEL